jgi:hypothetical protein
MANADLEEYTNQQVLSSKECQIVLNIKVMVFWVLWPCSNVAGYNILDDHTAYMAL